MPRTSEDIYDELLVLQIQGGQTGALDELVSRWNERLWRAARHHTGDHDAASDVVQEAWIAIVKGLRRLDDPAKFGPWCRRIVANKSADWIRKKRRDRATAEKITRDAHDTYQYEQPEPIDVVGLLRRALRALPPDRRQLLALHYHEGLGVAAIANLLAIPAGTVKSRLHHARGELKTILERNES